MKHCDLITAIQSAGFPIEELADHFRAEGNKYSIYWIRYDDNVMFCQVIGPEAESLESNNIVDDIKTAIAWLNKDHATRNFAF